MSTFHPPSRPELANLGSSRMVGEDTANSYVAYAGRVARMLQADLEQLDLTDPGVAKIARRLESSGVLLASVRNCLSVLRA